MPKGALEGMSTANLALGLESRCSTRETLINGSSELSHCWHGYSRPHSWGNPKRRRGRYVVRESSRKLLGYRCECHVYEQSKVSPIQTFVERENIWHFRKIIFNVPWTGSCSLHGGGVVGRRPICRGCPVRLLYVRLRVSILL